MKVRIADAAWQDMLLIARSVAARAPARAGILIDQLYEACNELSSMPEAHALVPGHEKAGIRRRLCGPYLIFFRVGDHAVEILRVLHGARDYERLLLADDASNG